MTIEEYYKTNWHRGNEVKLNNGKVYLVKGTKGHRKFLLLYSAEYDANFVADYRIIDCRTSDYEEPEEVYLEKKRQKQAEAEALREAERQERLKAKEERKRRNLEEQERIHQEALARKAAKRALMEEEQKAKAKAKAEKDAAKAEEKAKAKAEAKAKKAAAKAEAKPVAKAEPKPVAKPAAKAEPVATAEPASSEATGEQPKRKRKRIGISRIEKVLVKFTK